MKYEPEKYYHVYNRGANKGRIFGSSENYRYCLRLLEKNATKYKVRVLAYCLMPNHYHLLLTQTLEGSIQRCIQTLFNSYTQAFNKQQQRSGTLFEGRAKARVVDSDLYAAQLCAYIHLNPVAARLVKAPELWEFSDYDAWIEKPRNHENLVKDSTLRKDKGITDLSLRNSYFENGKTYQSFVEEQQRMSADTKLGPLFFD